MEKWFVTAKKADFEKWARELQISPILARILRNRDLTDIEEAEEFLGGSLQDIPSPHLLKDVEKGAEIILDAIAGKEKIRVIGDYDVDGICSSYILTKGLKLLGAEVDTAIPHRIHDGYGLNENLIEEADGDRVTLIVTCDNGIAAAPQIAYAREKGIRVVVTDHHEVPFSVCTGEDGSEIRQEILPPANAIINPKQKDCTYPFSGICGAVVAYKLVQVLLDITRNPGLEQAMDELLEFAALATVCDVMELKKENRIIVKQGLKRMKKSANPGLRALMEVNQIDTAKLTGHHLGFIIGPCLNATGRLDTAVRALELLQQSTREEAMVPARELKELNDSRKNLTLQGVEEAIRYIESNGMQEDKVLVVYLPGVHESIAGIIAGRVRERYNHPVFILTKGEEGVKGSGRSVEGYHMYEAMTAVKELFTKYGGHAMAAGLSMEEEKIGELRRRLNEACMLTEEDFQPKVHIDVPLPLAYATENLADELELLEPFGVGNAKPLFAQKNLRLLYGNKVGANKNFAKLTVLTPEGTKHNMMFFGNLEQFEQFLEDKFGEGSARKLFTSGGDFEISAVYQLGKNTFRGKSDLQFTMTNYC